MAAFDHARFFLLGEDFARGALRVRPARALRSARRLTRGELTRKRPLAFERDEGSRRYDLIGSTHGPLLVSDGLIGALDGFSGWTTYPVAIEGIAGGYHGLAVTGRAGPVDDALSPRVLLRPPAPEGNAVPGRRGLLFQPATWDGSDVFLLGDSTIPVVTEAVADALRSARVTNVALESITEVERIWDAD